MSGATKIESFNPIIILVWIGQLILLGIDYSQDESVSWSIPIIGSVFLIQLYFVWKTNYDEMMEERREARARALGGPMDTPTIEPGKTNLRDVNTQAQKSKSNPSGQMINLNLASNAKKDNDNESNN